MAALGRVLSERKPGFSGTSRGLSLKVTREWGDGDRSQIFKAFIYHSKKLELYSESDKEP